jgi:DnaJ-class molecular chaperone
MTCDDTLYEALEISPRASMEVVKAAYRCLAQRHHPDKHVALDNDVSNNKLILINNAYSVLSDPVARQDYDRAMGFHNQYGERRGGSKEQVGGFAATASTPNASRPFGFRPI